MTFRCLLLLSGVYSSGDNTSLWGAAGRPGGVWRSSRWWKPHFLPCLHLILSLLCLPTVFVQMSGVILYYAFIVTGLHDVDEYIQAQLLLAVSTDVCLYLPVSLWCHADSCLSFRLWTSPHMSLNQEERLWPRWVQR